MVDYPSLAAAEIFAAAPKFYRRFYFRPGYRGRAALVCCGIPGTGGGCSRKAGGF